MAQRNMRDLLALLPLAGTVLVQGCSAEADAIGEAVMNAGDGLGALDFTGIQVPGINRRTWLANERCRFTSYFMTPELKAAGDAVRFLPLCYGDILRHLRNSRIEAAIFSVTPPDTNGLCSFGPTVDFLAELWPRIPIRIAQINPLLPRTSGSTGIPLKEIHGWIEVSHAPPEMSEPPHDDATATIAAIAAARIADGATVQAGLGKLPSAILRALADHRRLHIHSGLIGDAVLSLLRGGAIEQGNDIVTGVAIGTGRFYSALPDSGIRFEPVSHTHDPRVIGALHNVVTINSAMEVDLFGQAYAEAGPTGWNSGPGGASDFSRGARIASGLRMVALPASARGSGRIVAAGAARGPVSLGRMDNDMIITEHGAADLRGLSHDERAKALIAIARPEDRETLARGWRDGLGRYA